MPGGLASGDAGCTLPEYRPAGVSGTLGAGSGATSAVAGAGFGVAVDGFGVVLTGVAGGLRSAQPKARAPKARKASQFRVTFVLQGQWVWLNLSKPLRSN